jgi:hypothetical protein
MSRSISGCSGIGQASSLPGRGSSPSAFHVRPLLGRTRSPWWQAGSLPCYFAAAFSLLLAACSDPRERAGKTLEKVTADQLRRDAAVLYKRLFAGHGTDFVVVRAKDWPESFQRFSPIRVGAYSDGMSLALESRDSGEAGIYIVPATMEHQPSLAHGGRFERMADGVYWYSFGD